jgi:hypothetical protein
MHTDAHMRTGVACRAELRRWAKLPHATPPGDHGCRAQAVGRGSRGRLPTHRFLPSAERNALLSSTMLGCSTALMMRTCPTVARVGARGGQAECGYRGDSTNSSGHHSSAVATGAGEYCSCRHRGDSTNRHRGDSTNSSSHRGDSTNSSRHCGDSTNSSRHRGDSTNRHRTNSSRHHNNRSGGVLQLQASRRQHQKQQASRRQHQRQQAWRQHDSAAASAGAREYDSGRCHRGGATKAVPWWCSREAATLRATQARADNTKTHTYRRWQGDVCGRGSDEVEDGVVGGVAGNGRVLAHKCGAAPTRRPRCSRTSTPAPPTPRATRRPPSRASALCAS